MSGLDCTPAQVVDVFFLGSFQPLQTSTRIFFVRPHTRSEKSPISCLSKCGGLPVCQDLLCVQSNRMVFWKVIPLDADDVGE